MPELNAQSSLETLNRNKTVIVRVNIMRRLYATSVSVEKQLSIPYSECVFVASLIQHSMCRRHKILFVVFGSTMFFPHCVINGTIFVKSC